MKPLVRAIFAPRKESFDDHVLLHICASAMTSPPGSMAKGQFRALLPKQGIGYYAENDCLRPT